jgi:hypothetical protein
MPRSTHTALERLAVTNLVCDKLLFVFLPTSTDTIARLRTITGFLLRCLVLNVLIRSLLREEVSEPFGILL